MIFTSHSTAGALGLLIVLIVFAVEGVRRARIKRTRREAAAIDNAVRALCAEFDQDPAPDLSDYDTRVRSLEERYRRNTPGADAEAAARHVSVKMLGSRHSGLDRAIRDYRRTITDQ